MTIDVLSKIQDEFQRYPVMRGAHPSCEDAVGSIEEFFGCRLPAAYRRFLLMFGGGIVGSYPIYGTTRAEPMDAHLWHVIEVTKSFRQQAWPGAEDVLVISEDLGGNPIYLTKDGRIETYDHDSDKHEQLAEDFYGFLAQCL